MGGQEQVSDLLAVARGDRPADVLLTGARLVNVLSGEIEETPLAVAHGHIAGLGPGYAAREVHDLGGRYVTPGWIDAHVHIESSLVRPAEFARAVVPRGVTTVITDPHEIANVCGLEGIRFMLEDAARVPLEVFVNAPACVPSSPLSTSGAELGAADLAPLLAEARVLGLAEMMNYPGVVAGDPAVLAKLAAFRGRVLDGHAPGLGGLDLNTYIAAGISSDHESTTLAEAREKLRRGLAVFLREATNARNLEALLPLVGPSTERRLCFCTDDRVPRDLLDEGSIDHLLRRAVAAGVDPIVALRLATLNPAEHYRLDDRGALAPGRRADLVVVSDLEGFRAEEVWIAGRRVAAAGRPLFEAPGAPSPLGRVDLGEAPPDFTVPAPPGAGATVTVRVIGLEPGQLLTRHETAPVRVEDGRIPADPERNLLKIAVLERHRGSGRIGKGIVSGFGLARGALAGTYAHDHHNLVVVGADEASMTTAVRAVAEAGGGLAAARGDRVLARLALPLGGLMSDRPIEEVRRSLDDLLAAARELGCPLHDPFMALSFLTLEVIPSLKITDRGLVDVERFEVVELVVPHDPPERASAGRAHT